MNNLRVVSEVDVMCFPQTLYDFVTTPDNWVGTHPATRDVKGDTGISEGLGAHWIEVIEGPGGRQFEAEWWVINAEPPGVWEIQTDDFGGLPATVSVTYTLTEGPAAANGGASSTSSSSSNTDNGITHFRRDMVTSFPDDYEVSDVLREALTSSLVHDRYLQAVKERIETNDGPGLQGAQTTARQASGEEEEGTGGAGQDNDGAAKHQPVNRLPS
jgi:hypothetical protein